ncbi:MAG: hypothetical protein JTT11_07700, partial [Candidatus Brockarchaeota archaeon]|nr:hypothetical protein [Candidatus Brockarchaeota archaeon]
MKRPTGVTVLAILDIAFGAIMAIGALGLVALTRLVEMNLSEFADLPSFGLLMGAIGSMLSVVLLAIAAVEFLLAWGLLGGKGWAWTATIVFSAIAIAIELLSLPFSLVGIAVNALVIYYFFRPNVKAFF